MIVDGKYIEKESIPLDRLLVPVETSDNAALVNAAINSRISAIESLEAPAESELMQFHGASVNHFAATVGDSEESAHAIADNYITKSMLNPTLSNDIVYRTGATQEITSAKNFKDVTVGFAAASTTGTAINVTKGKTVTQALESTSLAVSGTTNLNGSQTNTKNLKVDGQLTVTGKVILNSTITNVTEDNTLIKDKTITLNDGGSTPDGSGIDVYASGVAIANRAKLYYSGAGVSGWSVRKSGANQTEQILATMTDLANNGGQNATQVSTSVKNSIISEVKKIIVGGTTVDPLNSGASAAMFKGWSGITITLPAAFASTKSEYIVIITPGGTEDKLPAVSNSVRPAQDVKIGDIGDIYVRKIDADSNGRQRFIVYNSGCTAASSSNYMPFMWVAINVVKMAKYGTASIWS